MTSRTLVAAARATQGQICEGRVGAKEKTSAALDACHVNQSRSDAAHPPEENPDEFLGDILAAQACGKSHGFAQLQELDDLPAERLR